MMTRYGGTRGAGRLGYGLGSIVGSLLGGGRMRQAGMADAALAGAGGGGNPMAQQQLMAGLLGLDMPKVQQLGDLVATGGWGPAQEMAGPVEPGQARPMVTPEAPEWFTPDIREKLNVGLMALGLSGMGRAATPDKLGDMLLTLNKFGAVQRGAAGQMPPESLAASYGAILGKPNYHQGRQGAMNQYTGALGGLGGGGLPMGGSRSRAELVNAAPGGAAKAAGTKGRPAATVQFLDYLTANGVPLDQALRVQQTAKVNPLRATIDLAKGILESQKMAPRDARVTPEQAMAKAKQIVGEYMQSMAPDIGGAGDDDDPLDLLGPE